MLKTLNASPFVGAKQVYSATARSAGVNARVQCLMPRAKVKTSLVARAGIGWQYVSCGQCTHQRYHYRLPVFEWTPRLWAEPIIRVRGKHALRPDTPCDFVGVRESRSCFRTDALRQGFAVFGRDGDVSP